MFAKNNQISGRQMTRLLIFDLLGYSALLIPSVLAKTSGNDGVLSIGLGVLAGFFYLKILKSVSQKMPGGYEKGLVDLFGKIGGNFIKTGYLIYFLLLAGRVTAVLGELVVKELLEKEFRVVLLPVMVLVYYGVQGGVESRARVYEILFWILLIPLGIMMLLAVPAVDTDYWMPIFSSDAGGILKGGYQVFLGVSVLLLVPFFTEYISEKETIFVCGKRALLCTGIVLVILYLILLGMFGKDALAGLDYPAVTMMSRIQMTGCFLKRADAFMFGIWFFTLYALINSLVFFAGKLWRRGKKSSGFCWLAEVIIVYVLANAFYDSNRLQGLYERFFKYIGTPFVVLVPVAAAVLLMIRQKGGLKEKNEHE